MADDKSLMAQIEELFPYRGETLRAFYDTPSGTRIEPRTYALRCPDGKNRERRLRDAMLEAFRRAKHTLGGRDDVGIVWRRPPYLVTEDDGTVLLRLRCALIDADGQIDVSGLPLKVEGVPSRSIDADHG